MNYPSATQSSDTVELPSQTNTIVQDVGLRPNTRQLTRKRRQEQS